MIRKACVNDLDKILLIEKDVYESPWNYENFLYELKNSISRFYVYEENEVLGYIIYWELFNDSLNINEIEIVNIAVDKKHQSKGLGRKLLEYVLNNTSKPFVVFLDVRIDNIPAFNLYNSLGFKITGIRKDFYGKNKDAYTMKLTNYEVEYAQP